MREQIHGGDVYRHRDVLDFSSNMNPLGTPKSVIEAACESMKYIGNYPDIQQEELIRGLSAYENVPREWLVCGNGAAELIFTLVLALKPGKALLLSPTFAEYKEALHTVGCEISYYSLTEESGFLPQEDILERITPELDLVILCNPNNPTGLLIEPGLMDQILERCRKQGCFLVIDECFQDFIPEREAHTKKQKLEEYENLFLLKAFTKRYAMAGIRLGYGLCSDRQVLEAMQRCVQPWNVSIPAQAAGAAALLEEDYVEAARELISREREFLKQELKKLAFTVYDSQANYIFFHGLPGLAERTLEYGVMIRDCGNYRGLSSGYYRIAVKTHGENQRLLDTLASVKQQEIDAERSGQ